MAASESDLEAPIPSLLATTGDYESTSVAIQIIDVLIAEDKLKTSVTYKIRVKARQSSDACGTFEVLRQYHEFAAARKAMAALWPGLFIPPVPPKKLVVRYRQGSAKVEMIEDRRLILEEFLKKTVENRILSESEVFQTFIKLDSKEIHEASDPAFSPEVVQRYCETFSKFDRPCPENTSETIASTKRFLTSTLETIRSIRSVSKSVSMLYAALGTANSEVAAAAQAYESTTLQQGLSLMKSPDADMRCNPFTLVRDWSCVEVQDLKAMIEVCYWQQEAEAYRRRIEANYHSEQAALHKLQDGKLSLALLFKHKADLVSAAEQRVAQVTPSAV